MSVQAGCEHKRKYGDDEVREIYWPFLLAAAAVLLLVLTIAVLLEAGLGGLGQRLIFVLLYVWVLILAGRLLHLTGPSTAEESF